jgi:hypothetical protein
MRKSKFLVAASVIVLIALVYQISARAMVVKNVVPHATLSQRIRYMVRPPYQMATPHRTVSCGSR